MTQRGERSRAKEEGAIGDRQRGVVLPGSEERGLEGDMYKVEGGFSHHQDRHNSRSLVVAASTLVFLQDHHRFHHDHLRGYIPSFQR